MGAKALEPHSGLFFKQTRKGCFQECLGCEAQTEFNIATMENKEDDILYAIEETNCCLRFFCGRFRPFDMNLHETNRDGPVVARYYRPFRCAHGACKCCCYQEMETRDSEGRPAGSTVETCYFCVPQYNVQRADGSVEYKLSQPTCCGGTCVNCCAEGFCNCRIPFYIFHPDDETNAEPKGKIVKVWSGLVNELFTDADRFECAFPGEAGGESKARLVGALLLVNHLHFEYSEAAHQHAGDVHEE